MDEVAIVPLSTRLPDFVVGGKVCRSGKLPCLFQQVGPSKGNVFDLVSLRNGKMKAKLSIAVLEKLQAFVMGSLGVDSPSPSSEWELVVSGGVVPIRVE